MGGKAYGHSDSQAGGASVQNFSDSSGKPALALQQKRGEMAPLAGFSARVPVRVLAKNLRT